MSMLSNILNGIGSLIFAEECIICHEPIASSLHGVCTKCRYQIPTTQYWLYEENPVTEHFDGLVPIYRASSFIFYSTHSPWRNAIHNFKYHNAWRIAYNMARWYGRELKSSGLYDDVDIVVPIPLHYKKLLKRSYNQSTYIAEGIACELGIDYNSHLLYRRRNNPPQARNKASQRWQNVEELFAVRNAKRLQGKHILIVDDVLTTGATICSCVEAILRVAPDCRVSVATLAVTRSIERD